MPTAKSPTPKAATAEYGQPTELLNQRFGLSEFRPGQLEVITCLLAGHSSAAVFPTGGGKSLCYQLPALALPGLTLVVSPLIALMKDQIDALNSRGITAARLDSTLTGDEYRQVIGELRSQQLRLLYVAPERFNNERFRQLISQFEVSLFAVDEAHCISEWGHNFRPDYLKLARFAEQCCAERILALTATAPPKVLDDICNEFSISKEHAVRTEFYRPNLTLLSSVTQVDQRDDQLLTRLKARPRGATIVYVTLQKTAQHVAKLLGDNGLPARAYHAGMKPEDRSEAQDWFLSESDGIIAATIAFGMGIDKSDIRYVYHYNLSKSIENYAQEIGRAGRDGKPASCETLLVRDDLRTLENFVFGDTPDEDAVHALLSELFSRGTDFGVSTYQMSATHDIRDLVVRTLLTYLELDGHIEGGTPYYAEYRFKPLLTSAEMLSQFQDERRAFLANVLSQSKPGRTWYTLDIEAAATATRSDRMRVIRALDYLAEQQMLEVHVAGVHHRYRRLTEPKVDDLAQLLHRRCVERQQRELQRLRDLVTLLTHDGCQVSELGGYFGEPLPNPCGHCGWCQRGIPVRLPDAEPVEIDPQLWQQIIGLQSQYPQVFSNSRATARFASGATTPALVKNKLTRHELFGSMGHVPFQSLLDRCTSG